MFVVWLGSILTTVWLFVDFSGFNLQICLWLWFTCLFANFAEAMAEGRGKAHADELRKMRTKMTARKLVNGQRGGRVQQRTEDRGLASFAPPAS